VKIESTRTFTTAADGGAVGSSSAAPGMPRTSPTLHLSEAPVDDLGRAWCFATGAAPDELRELSPGEVEPDPDPVGAAWIAATSCGFAL
jgi:hypothetical protein